MHIDWWTLLFQTINFLILVWLLQRFLYRPVLAVIDRRRKATDELVESAKRARDEVEAQRAGLEADREQIGRERDAMLAEARRDADEVRATMIADAREDVEKMMAEARGQLAREREDAVVELHRHARTLAVGLADHVLTTVADERLDDAFFDAAIASLEELPPDELASLRKAVAKSNAKASAIRLVTAKELEPEQKARYQAAVAKLLGGEAAVGYAVDSDLIAGVEIHLPHTIVHHSARTALDAAAKDIDDDDAAPRS
jgi:F-type H+-transporting ATPase subunit b